MNQIINVDFFTPYNKQFGNVDMNWDVLINMKINKYLNATLNTTLKYDNDVKTINDEGEKRGAKVQFKDILGIGVATISDKKKIVDSLFSKKPAVIGCSIQRKE